MIKEPLQPAYVMSGQFTRENCALVLIDHQANETFNPAFNTSAV
jgi:hypothetical protein